MTQFSMYVDGWNFYWSLVNAEIKPYGWCNFALLARQQLCASDCRVTVKYYTSPDEPHHEKIADRQKPIWWRALEYIGCEIHQGEFRSTRDEVEEHIREGRKTWREKETDIALASQMVADCSHIEQDGQGQKRLWTPGYDQAVLLSQDTDFIPAVRTIASEPFNRRVLVLLPPSGREAEAAAAVHWNQRARGPRVTIKQLRQSDLAKALLPKVVIGPNGERVECHHSWMWRERHDAEMAIRSRK